MRSLRDHLLISPVYDSITQEEHKETKRPLEDINSAKIPDMTDVPGISDFKRESTTSVRSNSPLSSSSSSSSSSHVSEVSIDVPPSLEEQIAHAKKSLKKIKVCIPLLKGLIKRYSNYSRLFNGTMVASFVAPFAHAVYSVHKFNQTRPLLDSVTYLDFEKVQHFCNEIFSAPTSLSDTWYRCGWYPDDLRRDPWEFPCAEPMQAICDNPGTYLFYPFVIGGVALFFLIALGCVRCSSCIDRGLDAVDREQIRQADPQLTQGKLNTLFRLAAEFNVEIPNINQNAKVFFNQFLENFQERLEEVQNCIELLEKQRIGRDCERVFILGSLPERKGATRTAPPISLLFTDPIREKGLINMVFEMAGTRPLKMLAKEDTTQRSSPQMDDTTQENVRSESAEASRERRLT